MNELEKVYKCHRCYTPFNKKNYDRYNSFNINQVVFDCEKCPRCNFYFIEKAKKYECQKCKNVYSSQYIHKNMIVKDSVVCTCFNCDYSFKCKDQKSLVKCQSCKKEFLKCYITRDYDIYHHLIICHNCDFGNSDKEKIDIKLKDDAEIPIKELFRNKLNMNKMHVDAFSEMILSYL